MNELWKDVPGYPGYQASAMGRIRSSKKGRRRILRQPKDSGGYKIVGLYKNKKMKPTRAHIVILITFHGKRPPGMWGRHLSGKKIDNRSVNLGWGTPKQNRQDAMDHGTAYIPVFHGKGSANPAAKLTEQKVIDIRKHREEGMRLKTIAEQYGISEGTAGEICRRETWRHIA